ncbi:hypothetical protein B488_07780 [Liberibacter crescens BT-1]|uniref:Uncharacterized protein n=2 Tax=Liberibacter crescens TaxID=1273132 RepID=L0EV89_LIBCB|nr:hypothetical protein B488_07780 [Liberibacter crescens BT-1]AMC13368.1 hypothetical protein RL73_03945 [Liberibacter crescens]
MQYDYATLLMDVKHYATKKSLPAMFNVFLQRVENRLNRELRLREMEKKLVVSLKDGCASLPEDYLEMRRVQDDQGKRLPCLSLESFSGEREGYMITANILCVSSSSHNKDIHLLYYGRLPALRPDNPRNWLLDKASDIYLYGLIEEISIWEENPDKAAAADVLLQEAIRRVQVNDHRARWGTAAVTLSGLTP